MHSFASSALQSAANPGEGTSGRAQPVRMPGIAAALPGVAGPVLIALLIYLFVVYSLLAGFDFNPIGLVRIGDDWPTRRFWTESTYVHPGIGYDGQFFYFIAHDPLIQANDPREYIDHPAYRYGRILYPALVWMAALGRAEALAWAMVAVNLAMVLIGTAAAVAILRSVGAQPWLALGYAFSPAIAFGVMADLSEPTAFALVAVGLALSLRGRHEPAGLSLALATLAREASAVVPFVFGVRALLRRRGREATAYLAPLALPALWHAWLWLRLGALPITNGPPNFGPPFGGAVHRFGALLGLWPPLVPGSVPDQPLSELMFVGVSIALILYGLTILLWRRDILAWQLWAQAAVSVCTTSAVWVGLASYGRVLGLLYLFACLVLLTPRIGHRAPRRELSAR